MNHRIFVFLLFSIIISTSYSQQDFTTNGNPYTILRSTVGVSGSSKALTFDEKSYNVSQSIGQASVIGTYKIDDYALLQGYQQPFIAVNLIETPPENNLNATVFPNPFQQSIKIAFDELITDDINILLSDIMGRIIISKKFPASQLINLQLANIPDGIYVINIKVENKQFIAKITKQ